MIGILVGSLFGLTIGLIAKLWIGSTKIAITVGLAMLINVAIAPLIALIVPEILLKERMDPALGAGPFYYNNSRHHKHLDLLPRGVRPHLNGRCRNAAVLARLAVYHYGFADFKIA